MEIERKFLLDAPPAAIQGRPGTWIAQGYVAITDDAEVRTRERASAAYLKHAPLDRFRVLHLATHALVDERAVTRTALAVAAVLMLTTAPGGAGGARPAPAADIPSLAPAVGASRAAAPGPPPDHAARQPRRPRLGRGARRPRAARRARATCASAGAPRPG